jgi:hypothetical protein
MCTQAAVPPLLCSPVARHILILPSQPNPSTPSDSPNTNHPASTPATSSEPKKIPHVSHPPGNTQHGVPSPESSPSINAIDSASNDPLNSEQPIAPSQVSIVIFQSLVGERTTEVEYIRRGRFSEPELDAIASGIRIGIGDPTREAPKGLAKGLRKVEPDEQAAREKRRSRGRVAASLSKLESMGVIVYGAETLFEEDGEPKPLNPLRGTWGHLAGYEEQKQEIEDTILLALQKPEVYDQIARGTRREYESNRPRAILFDGPPGAGSTPGLCFFSCVYAWFRMLFVLGPLMLNGLSAEH